MKLFIDIGNSKSKWSLVENQIDQRSGSFFNHDIDEFVVPEDIDEVTIASVGREEYENILISKLKFICKNIIFAQIDKQLLEINYSNELGIDRWLGALAVTKRTTNNAILIDAGSAVTIDFIRNDAPRPIFEGGLILPGLHLFNQSLVEKSADISLKNKVMTAQINNTDMALMHGFLMSVSGAIEKFLNFYQLDIENTDFFISGGDAELIFNSTHLGHKLNFKWVENIVIDGLKIYQQLTFSNK
ncbi:type III pantothenate kinase [Methylophilaceae bacterium]|nr:type III pantothenate kinase [Methylophilaceae bacterium]